MTNIIRKKEGIKILQKFFQFDTNLSKLCLFYQQQNYSSRQIQQYLKNKFREIILDLQHELYLAKKIKHLKIFDNSSDQLFEVLFDNLKQYFPPNFGYDFVFEQKCKYQKVEKSSSSKKIELYMLFLNYAEQHDLFRFVVIDEKREVRFGKGLVETPENIYQPHELQLICFYYETLDGDFDRIGYNSVLFKSQILIRNVINFLLIGLYKCYRKSVQSRNSRGLGWQKFIQDYQQHLENIKQWDQNLKIILLKIAIRRQVKPQLILFICKKLSRRFQDKPFIQTKRLKDPPLQIFDGEEITQLRFELIAVLKTKIWFNTPNNNS